jgi:hypothetical protein
VQQEYVVVSRRERSFPLLLGCLSYRLDRLDAERLNDGLEFHVDECVRGVNLNAAAG